VPFTPAHAAAALPFRRSFLPTAAIVIGTMSPDFEYFLRLAPRGHFGHTAVGVLVMDLPLSLLVLWLYGRDLRPTFIALFFDSAGHPESKAWDVPGVTAACAGILVGAATHILWDSFTHRSFWPYQHMAVLHKPIFLLGTARIELYEVLQQLSSLVGLLVVGVWCWRLLKTDTRHRGVKIISGHRKDLAACAAFIGISSVMRASGGATTAPEPLRIAVFVGDLVVTTMSLTFLAILSFSVIYVNRQIPPRPPQTIS